MAISTRLKAGGVLLLVAVSLLLITNFTVKAGISETQEREYEERAAVLEAANSDTLRKLVNLQKLLGSNSHKTERELEDEIMEDFKQWTKQQEEKKDAEHEAPEDVEKDVERDLRFEKITEALEQKVEKKLNHDMVRLGKTLVHATYEAKTEGEQVAAEDAEGKYEELMDETQQRVSKRLADMARQREFALHMEEKLNKRLEREKTLKSSLGQQKELIRGVFEEGQKEEDEEWNEEEEMNAEEEDSTTDGRQPQHTRYQDSRYPDDDREEEADGEFEDEMEEEEDRGNAQVDEEDEAARKAYEEYMLKIEKAMKEGGGKIGDAGMVQAQEGAGIVDEMEKAIEGDEALHHSPEEEEAGSPQQDRRSQPQDERSPQTPVEEHATAAEEGSPEVASAVAPAEAAPAVAEAAPAKGKDSEAAESVATSDSNDSGSHEAAAAAGGEPADPVARPASETSNSPTAAVEEVVLEKPVGDHGAMEVLETAIGGEGEAEAPSIEEVVEALPVSVVTGDDVSEVADADGGEPAGFNAEESTIVGTNTDGSHSDEHADSDPAAEGDHLASAGDRLADHTVDDGEHSGMDSDRPAGDHVVSDGEHPDGDHVASDGDHPNSDDDHPTHDGEHPDGDHVASNGDHATNDGESASDGADRPDANGDSSRVSEPTREAEEQTEATAAAASEQASAAGAEGEAAVSTQKSPSKKKEKTTTSAQKRKGDKSRGMKRSNPRKPRKTSPLSNAASKL